MRTSRTFPSRSAGRPRMPMRLLPTDGQQGQANSKSAGDGSEGAALCACARPFRSARGAMVWEIGRLLDLFARDPIKSGALGVTAETAMNCAWVAGAIETSRRREVLSFGHHQHRPIRGFQRLGIALRHPGRFLILLVI